MARIPTPVAPGQEVGSVKQQFTATPFQKINAPIEAFGGGDANIAAALAPDVGAFASDLAQINIEDDKSDLAAMDDEISKVNLDYEMRVKNAQGQERLDLIKGGAGPGGGQTMAEDHLYDVKAVREKYNFRTDSTDKSADIKISSNNTMFRSIVFSEGQVAKKEINKKLMFSRVATAMQEVVTVASSATATDIKQGTPGNPFNQILKVSLGKAESAVLDKDIGLAKQNGVTDPELKDLMVKAQKAAILDGTANDLISRGKEAEAIALVDKYSDVLDGTKEGLALQNKVLPFKTAVKAQEEFNQLVTRTNGDPIKMAQAIEGAEPQLQQRLQSQFAPYNARITAERNDSMSTEVLAAFNKQASGQNIQYSDIPTIAKYNPKLAYTLVNPTNPTGPLKQRQVKIRESNWTAQNGPDAIYNDGVQIAMENLKNRPQEYIDMVRSGALQKRSSAEQFSAFKSQADLLQADLMEKATAGKDKFNLKGFLTDKRFKLPSGTADNLISQYGTSILNMVSSTYTEQLGNGKSPIEAAAEAQKAVASMLLTIEIDKTFPDLPNFFGFNQNWDMAVAVNAGVPDDNIAIEDTDRNMQLLSEVFDITLAEVKAAFKEGMTISKFATQAEANDLAATPSSTKSFTTPKTIADTLAAREETDNMVFQYGYTPDFIRQEIETAGGAYSPNSVRAFLQQAGSPTVGAAALPAKYKQFLIAGGIK